MIIHLSEWVFGNVVQMKIILGFRYLFFFIKKMSRVCFIAPFYIKTELCLHCVFSTILLKAFYKTITNYNNNNLELLYTYYIPLLLFITLKNRVCCVESCFWYEADKNNKTCHQFNEDLIRFNTIILPLHSNELML